MENLITLPLGTPISLDGATYIISSINIKEGDILLDRRTNKPGICDSTYLNGDISVIWYEPNSHTSEIVVKVNKVYRLAPFNPRDN